MPLLPKNSAISLLLLTWVTFWITTLAALVVYVIAPSKFSVVNSQIYLGTLTSLQAALYLAFLVGGGTLTLLATFCLLIRLDKTITQCYEVSKVPSSSITLPPTELWPEQKTYPLELGKTINTIIDYIKAHPIKIGTSLIVLGPALWGAFIWNTARVDPTIRSIYTYQILFIAVPIISIISTLIGIVLIFFYLKNRKAQ